MDFENIVLEGGGVKGIAYIGALRALEEKGLLKNIKRIAGSSAGAIFAGALACDFTIEEMIALSDVNFEDFKDDSFSLFGNAYRLLKEYGLYGSETFYKWYGKQLERKTGDKDITLIEVYNRYGKEIILTGTCLDKRKTVYFHHSTHPNMPLRLAVRISMTIPFYYKAIRLNSDLYVDGGMLDNYPMGVFDKESNNYIVSDISKTIGLKLMTEDEEPNVKLFKGDTEIHNIKEFISEVISTLLVGLERVHMRQIYWEKTIPIDTFGYRATDFNMTDQDKLKLIDSGYKNFMKYFENKK